MVTNKVVYAAVVLAVALASHLVTVRSMSGELERWSSLGNSLTEMAGECVSLLPEAWAADQDLKFFRKIP